MSPPSATKCARSVAHIYARYDDATPGTNVGCSLIVHASSAGKQARRHIVPVPRCRFNTNTTTNEGRVSAKNGPGGTRHVRGPLVAQNKSHACCRTGLAVTNQPAPSFVVKWRSGLERGVCGAVVRRGSGNGTRRCAESCRRSGRRNVAPHNNPPGASSTAAIDFDYHDIPTSTAWRQAWRAGTCHKGVPRSSYVKALFTALR